MPDAGVIVATPTAEACARALAAVARVHTSDASACYTAPRTAAVEGEGGKKAGTQVAVKRTCTMLEFVARRA